jgi:disulfide bond formation protein DsbB
MNFSNRIYFVLVSAICTSLLLYGYYLEFFEDLLPCPMCIFQRLCYIAIVLVGTIGAIHGPGRIGAVSYDLLIAIAAGIGAGIAGRQTWLQHLPPELVPECGPDLAFMMEMYPLLETIERALRGTGDCAEVARTFVGFSIAEWSLLCFLGLLITALWQLVASWRSA